MSAKILPKLFLARHGDTEWTDARRHTGRTDVPLNQEGQEHAREMGQRLRRFSFVRVLTSPLIRASQTCALAGFGATAVVDPALMEWDYGRYEGKHTIDITQDSPGWEIFRDGCSGGESPGDVAGRADAFIARVHQCQGNVLAFSHGHMIRMIAARWNRLPPAEGRIFFCRPASLGILGFEHESWDEPVVQLWNCVSDPGE
ncbi:MAG: histidine phosphatase family protein [Pirellulaceae bacterium]